MQTGQNMNGAQVRVVDPILSRHARGYINADFIGDVLFPEVTMASRAAKRIDFGRDAFRRRKTRRAPGTQIGGLSVGFEGNPVGLHQEALKAITPREYQEEANAVPGIDLQQESVDVVLAVIALEKEIQRAELARDASKYAASNKIALAGSDKWTDDASKPKQLIGDYSEVIRSRIGRRPNTLVIGGKVATKMKSHQSVLDQFKYTRSDSVTMQDLATYFDISNVVAGDAIYDEDDETSVDVWGNDVILAYVPPVGQRSMRVPAYGYTYQLRGHPFVEPVRYDGDLASYVNNVFDEFSPELVGPDAGVLIQAAI